MATFIWKCVSSIKHRDLSRTFNCLHFIRLHCNFFGKFMIIIVYNFLWNCIYKSAILCWNKPLLVILLVFVFILYPPLSNGGYSFLSTKHIYYFDRNIKTLYISHSGTRDISGKDWEMWLVHLIKYFDYINGVIRSCEFQKEAIEYF